MTQPTAPDQASFDALIPTLRPAPEIHPESTQDFDEYEFDLSLPDRVEDVSYHELAWEFLRRNRFYQALCDQAEGHLDDTHWGFQWNPKVPRSHGLVRPKPFRERYGDGAPPAWIGLDEFAEQLPTAPSEDFKTVSVQLRPGQVLMVFDISGLVAGNSPWEAQAWAAREHLQRLRSAQGISKDFFGKPRHKAVLLRQLRMFDLLSKGMPMESAVAELDYALPEAAQKKVRGRNHALYVQRQRAVATSTAFDDASEAYTLVYRHGYLSLLPHEHNYSLDGARLVPDTILYRDTDAPAKTISSSLANNS